MSMEVLNTNSVQAKEAAKPVSEGKPAVVATTVADQATQRATTVIRKDDAGSQSDTEGRQPSENTFRDVVSQMNHKLGTTKCEFQYHEATHMVSITIKDKDTNEVIKEIPPEKSLDMLQKMWEMAGILVDERR